uniref:Uncharacterized protein n=1 Tax=Arundo donax TaxID=35708 RepID=A0A0A9GMP0_ARUDO
MSPSTPLSPSKK